MIFLDAAQGSDAQVDDSQDDADVQGDVDDQEFDAQVEKHTQNDADMHRAGLSDQKSTDGVTNERIDFVTHYLRVCRSSRTRKPSERLVYDSAMFLQQARMNKDEATAPLTFVEADSGPDGKEWPAAMDEEMQQFDEMNTLKLVNLPKGVRKVKNKLV